MGRNYKVSTVTRNVQEFPSLGAQASQSNSPNGYLADSLWIQHLWALSSVERDRLARLGRAGPSLATALKLGTRDTETHHCTIRFTLCTTFGAASRNQG